ILGDVVIAQEDDRRRDVGLLRRAQEQSLRFQSATHVPSPSRGNKKGRWRTISLAYDEPPIGWRPMSSAALFCRCLRRRLLPRKHRYVGPTLKARLEGNVSVARREQRVVLAHADTFAGNVIVRQRGTKFFP